MAYQHQTSGLDQSLQHEILNRLGHEILSFGKNTTGANPNDNSGSQHSGNGIALFNAHKELSENGAQLIIHSIENHGCEIKIMM